MIAANREDVGDLIDNQADDAISHLHNDDGAAAGIDGTRHAKLRREVDHRNDRAAQVHDVENLQWNLEQRRSRCPSPDFPDRGRLDAELLAVKMEGDDFLRCIVIRIFH